MGHLFEKREDLRPLPRQLSLWKEGWGGRGDGEGRGEKNKEQKSPTAFMEGIFDLSRILFIPCKTNSSTAFFSLLSVFLLLSHCYTLPLKLSPVALHHLLFVFISSFPFSLFFCLFFRSPPLFLFSSPDETATSSQVSAQNTPPIRGLHDSRRFQHFVCHTLAGSAVKWKSGQCLTRDSAEKRKKHNISTGKILTGTI